jgi:membrane-associated phospholipid phosphatase
VKVIFKNNAYFLIPCFIFFLAGAWLMIAYSKDNLHLLFNSYHTPFLDRMIPTLNLLGDGLTMAIIGFLFLFIRFRYAFFILISLLIVAWVIYMLKNTFFQSYPRPVKFFEGIRELRLVPGVEPHHFNSFPSGHTATAFALFFCLAIITKNNFMKLFLFLLALVAAYSRIYLSQHFFEDVYAGAWVGLLAVMASWFLVYKSRKAWLDHSLITVFKKSK